MRHKSSNMVLRTLCFAVILAASQPVARTQSSQLGVSPMFSLSANGRANTQTYQGWALLLDAELCHPNLYSTSSVVIPLTISQMNGSWANTMQLAVTDNTGAAQNWPIQPVTIPNGPLNLDGTNVGRAAWVVAPSDTSTIAAGTYQVVGILNTVGSAGSAGWSGTRRSNPVSIQISAPPTSLSPEQQEEQAETLAYYDLLLGSVPKALSDVNALLAQQPNAIGALALQGDLLEQSGQTADALSAYNQALAAFFGPNSTALLEAPVGLLVPQGRLQSELLTQSGTRGQPQVAIQILDQGVQSPGVLFLDLQITNVGNDVAQNVQLNQITLETLGGTGQVVYNNVLSPQPPTFTDFLPVNSSATIRIFVAALGTVNSFSITESGAAADIFGTPVAFSQTQTVSANFTGNVGALTITASDATQQYGQPTPPLNNVTYTGFLNGDTQASLSGALTCTTTATQSSPAGTYPITCSGQSSTVYTITYVPGTLTVTPVPLSLTASNASRLYGAANPPLNNVIPAGFVNGDSITSLAGTLICTTTATQSSPVATYSITCSGLNSPNYSITFAPGLLTILPAALTITANNASRPYGAANPPLNSVTASGFVNGDMLASLTGTLVCTTPATSTSPAGAYSITCLGLASPNYSITFLPGTLTIASDVLTIAAGNATRLYGQPNPPLTNVTYTGFVNGDTFASLTGTLNCTTAAGPASNVGTYAITCSGLTSPNYAITYMPGALSITPAPLAIVASNAPRPYGANNPALTGIITGLQNADPITANFTTTALPSSPVGSYAITPVVLDPANRLGNYAPSLVNGTLSVLPETTILSVAISPSAISVGQSATITVTLTAPDMVIPIPSDPTVLAPVTVTSPIASDILSNNGTCVLVPTAATGAASCTVTVTSIQPNGRTLNASFGGSLDLLASSATAALTVTAPLQGQQSCIRSDFRNIPVPGGNYLWFNSVFRARDVSPQLLHISFFQGSVQFQYTDAGGNLVTVNQPLPDAHITIDPNAGAASTTFDSANNVWNTTLPWDIDDNAFLTGIPWLVSPGGIPGDIEPVTVCGTFASDVAGIDIGWRWSAAAYSAFSADNTALGVKPMDTDHDNQAANRDRAGTPENYKQSVIAGARGNGAKNYTGTYSGSRTIE